MNRMSLLSLVVNKRAGSHEDTVRSWTFPSNRDTVANAPILKPPQYSGGSLKAQVATLIHETAHGIQVELFQNDTGIQKAGNYNDQFLYQNCHSLIDGIQ
jgi:hypothetical protein